MKLSRRDLFGISVSGLFVPEIITAQQPREPRPRRNANPPDPVLSHVVDELRDIHQRRRKGGIHGGEHARRAAGVFGLIQSYAPLIDLDNEVIDSIKKRVSTDGMHTLFTTLQPNRDVAIAEMKTKGFNLSNLPEFTAIEPNTIELVVNKGLAEGITPVFAQTQQYFLLAATPLDKVALLGNDFHIQTAQGPAFGSDCWTNWHYMIECLMVWAGLVCSNILLFASPELCAAVWAAIALCYMDMFIVCQLGWG